MARYTLLYRPPTTFHLPKGFELVERPAQGLGFDLRTDLPLSSYTFGVVEYPEPLSAEDVERYDMKRVD